MKTNTLTQQRIVSSHCRKGNSYGETTKKSRRSYSFREHRGRYKHVLCPTIQVNNYETPAHRYTV